jgi:1-hydroxycarotenoid 3,4-desaturase
MNSFSRTDREHVVVIGAGMGGLSCAIDLARAGFRVTVVERAARPGGKMREVTVAGARIDAGPTVFTMRWVFDALFEGAGSTLDRHIALKPLDLLARHAWSETERLDLFAELERSSDAIGAFAGAAEAKGFRAFSAEARKVFEMLRDAYLTEHQTGPIGLTRRVGLGNLASMFALRPFDTLWTALGDHFRDPRLRQLFGRYATYCGSSPFAAPATLMLIAHVEQDGVWAVEGGMQRLADALEALAESLGVRFLYGAHAERVTLAGGRASGVTLAAGEALTSHAVVANADAAAIAAGAFGPDIAEGIRLRPHPPRSLSAVTWALHARTAGFPLHRHNVFFSGDYRAEFDDIFTHGRLPGAPTIYVCAEDRSLDGVGVAGAERLLVLVNAPANGDQTALDEPELSRCETMVFDQLQRCGLTLDRSPECRTVTTPQTFNRLFPATGGALYGPATHGWASAFRRPGARTRIPGLYLAGGGAHPGAGVPMAALSGRLAAARLISDRASTFRFRRAAIVGGTSTR